MTAPPLDPPLDPPLYIDEHVCAIAKPTGIMVHYSRISTDTTFLADLLREQLGRRVWPAHRLDRATSGVLLFALNAEAAAVLGRQFEAGTVAKRYLALVRGWLDDGGVIDRPLKKSGKREQPAVTRYRCLARTELNEPVPPHPTARYSLVELEPETGRTHQLRRHLNGIAHPIVGDVGHGDRRHNRLFRMKFGCHRLLLHAASLAFDHPATGERMDLRCELASEFRAVVDALDWQRVADDARSR